MILANPLPIRLPPATIAITGDRAQLLHLLAGIELAHGHVEAAEFLAHRAEALRERAE